MIVDQILEEKVRLLCIAFKVKHAFEYVKKNNTSNNLPYHNWYHALCMVEKCIEGADYHNLPYRSIRHLILAALFHDFDHTGGKSTDDININRALKGLQLYEDNFFSDITSIETLEVKEFIRATEYPYVMEPICIEQKIIRDADLMQCLRPTWKEMIIDGLRQEMSIKLGKDLTEEEMCKGQSKFLDAIRPHSGWGKDVLFLQGKINIAKYNVDLLQSVIDRKNKNENNTPN